jgi:hypothetical protein
MRLAIGCAAVPLALLQQHFDNRFFTQCWRVKIFRGRIGCSKFETGRDGTTARAHAQRKQPAKHVGNLHERGHSLHQWLRSMTQQRVQQPSSRSLLSTVLCSLVRSHKLLPCLRVVLNSTAVHLFVLVEASSDTAYCDAWWNQVLSTSQINPSDDELQPREAWLVVAA